MLKTLNQVCKKRNICSFRKYTTRLQCLDLVNFAEVSIFCKKLALLGRNNTFLERNSMRTALKMFYFFFWFLLYKRVLLTNMDHLIRIPYSDFKLAITKSCTPNNLLAWQKFEDPNYGDVKNIYNEIFFGII